MQSIIHLPHHQQEFDYSCVATCVRMVLAWLEKDLPESTLRAILKTRASTGTHPINFRNLESLGVKPTWPHPATLADVNELIQHNTPVIAFLWTGMLKHWPTTGGVDYLHAVVIVGTTDKHILLHDPKLEDGPTEIPKADFIEAWKFANYLIAAIR